MGHFVVFLVVLRPPGAGVGLQIDGVELLEAAFVFPPSRIRLLSMTFVVA